MEKSGHHRLPQTYGVPFRQVPELGTGLLVPCRRATTLCFDRVVSLHVAEFAQR
jgi:hypothetical protein